MTISTRVKRYLDLSDRYMLNGELEGFVQNDDGRATMNELEAVWEELSDEERGTVDYVAHCSQYVNPVEYEIFGRETE